MTKEERMKKIVNMSFAVEDAADDAMAMVISHTENQPECLRYLFQMRVINKIFATFMMPAVTFSIDTMRHAEDEASK